LTRKAALKSFELVLAQWQDLARLAQQRLDILDLFGHHLEPVRRHVVGQQLAVAVVDQAARRARSGAA
jgi:hypothetical protein